MKARSGLGFADGSVQKTRALLQNFLSPPPVKVTGLKAMPLAQAKQPTKTGEGKGSLAFPREQEDRCD